MKNKLLTLSGSLLLFLNCWGEGDFQTWNDIQGRHFDAEIVSVSPGLVRLRNQEGKEIDFPTAHLLTNDQLRVIEWEKASKASKEPSEFVKEFADDLVIREGKKVSGYDHKDLGGVKYFAFYRSASWCGPCRNFTPQLVKFYDRMKPDHPEFELIFVSSDNSKDAMKKYMVDDEMSWPAFEFGKHKSLVTSYGNGIPCLIVTDAEGNKLYDSYTPEKKYLGASSVMRDLEKLLNE